MATPRFLVLAFNYKGGEQKDEKRDAMQDEFMAEVVKLAQSKGNTIEEVPAQTDKSRTSGDILFDRSDVVFVHVRG